MRNSERINNKSTPTPFTTESDAAVWFLQIALDAAAEVERMRVIQRWTTYHGWPSLVRHCCSLQGSLHSVSPRNRCVRVDVEDVFEHLQPKLQGLWRQRESVARRFCQYVTD